MFVCLAFIFLDIYVEILQLRIKEQKRARRHQKALSDLNDEPVELDTTDAGETDVEISIDDERHLIPMLPIGSKHQYSKLTQFVVLFLVLLAYNKFFTDGCHLQP